MTRSTHDRGTVLPLVLVFVVVLGFVVAGLSRYAATNLRYSTVVRDRTAATASAEAGLRYAIERVRTNSVTTCDNGPVRIAPTNAETFNDAATDITCQRLDGGQTTLAGWAAVITGVGIGSQEGLQIDETGDTVSTGRVYVESPRSSDLEVNNSGHVHFHDGDVFYDGSADDCGTIEQYGVGSYDDWDANDGALVCWPQTWVDIVDEPPIPSTLATLPVDPAWSTVGSCRVFEPGRYTSVDLDVGGDNYFRSGAYLFDDALIDTAGVSATPDTNILGGYPHDVRFENRLITSGPCSAAQAADGIDAGPHGVTWYFGGSSRIIIRRHATMELLPMLHDDGIREHAVSIHVLGPGSIKPETLGDLVQVVDDQDNSTYPYSHVLFQGQIWSPTQPIDLEDSQGDASGQVTSGVVAAQLLVESTNAASGTLGPDLTPADHLLLLSSTATVDDVTIEARAVVEYRPSAVVADRVAVRSVRFVD